MLMLSTLTTPASVLRVSQSLQLAVALTVATVHFDSLLEGEKYVTASWVVPMVKRIHDHLTPHVALGNGKLKSIQGFWVPTFLIPTSNHCLMSMMLGHRRKVVYKRGCKLLKVLPPF
jgi:hypothetical protein